MAATTESTEFTTESTELTAAAAAECATECAKLAAAFPGRVQFPGTPGYSANKVSYFTQFESEVSPACFIQPQSAQEVSAIIKHVRSSSSNLAIRSGGHTTWAGSANIQAGITIDLSKLKANAAIVDPETKLATIGAGARWGDVYKTLAAKGLTVVGGRVTSVGVGGLSLGGTLIFSFHKLGMMAVVLDLLFLKLGVVVVMVYSLS